MSGAFEVVYQFAVTLYKPEGRPNMQVGHQTRGADVIIRLLVADALRRGKVLNVTAEAQQVINHGLP
ncbi:MAG TPA: hypothetical protein VFO40_22260 [Chthoniobacterales bacterium]|nr:hypothetical protein [Chthoniobacterales bacterium]